jgi:dynein heavy chain 1
LNSIAQYVQLTGEKQEELQDQQRHINIGIDKLRETVASVEDLRRELSVKEKELDAKSAEANAKLSQMMSDQQEAEAKKLSSITIQENLRVAEQMTKARQAEVNDELSDVEPAVAAASNAVGNIKKQQLAELQKMRVPPAAIVMAAEATCALLGHQNLKDWTAISAIVRRDDFVYSIQHFDTEKVDAALCRRIERDYLSREDFTFEVVNRANKAMGPLALWVIAQVKFATILDRIGPLKQEVAQLERQAAAEKEQVRAVQEYLERLNASISRYTTEYAALISEKEAIKLELVKVQKKVDRSSTLLASLSQEEVRWTQDSQEFAQEMVTLAGDALLSAGFLTYLGFFDQRYRKNLRKSIFAHLKASNIACKIDLALPEYLANADERATWTNAGLPVDDLATENALMLKRFNRYPLLIDPTGQASTFLTNIYREKKIMSTSFIDASFVKNLESALRFGSPLLVHDVENLDPVLNSVLNKEIRRTGGRNLIRIGNQDIDLSPAFTMFLATRDPLIQIAPDLSSRVTVVNFTMTKGSLESQSLDKLLKAERPDTESRRTSLLKAQGEFKLRLRHLEQMLLQALNDSSGSILENDKLIATLEGLKREAADISQKMQQTESIASEIEQVTADYVPIARSASAIYFLLERLGDLHHFYRFSLRFFLDLFDDVLLRNPRLKDVRDQAERREIITQDLFLMSYERVARTLLQDDHILLALALAQLLPLHDKHSKAYEMLNRLTQTATAQIKDAPAILYTLEQQQLLARIPDADNIISSMNSEPESWTKIMTHPQPEVLATKMIQELETDRKRFPFQRHGELSLSLLLLL